MKFDPKYLLALLVPLSFWCGSRFINEMASYPWQKVSCTVKSSEIVVPDDNSKLRNRAQVIFSCDDPTVGIYNWKDFAEQSEAQKLLDQYKVGSTVTGYKKGSEIKLWRKPIWLSGLYLIPIALLIFSLHKVIPKVPPRKIATTPQSQSIVIKAPVLNQSSAIVLDDASQKSDWKQMYVVQSLQNVSGLKPRHAQMWQFIGLLAGGIILSAISAFAGFRAYQTFQSGGSPGCAAAIAPFTALAAIGVLRRSIQQMLGLLNPRPDVQSSSPSVWPGGFLDLSWRYEGKIGTARKIIFSLVGIEKIEVKEKTGNTYKYSKEEGISARYPIHESSEAYEIREGRARIKIPENIMHSLNYGPMKIEWKLKVEVQIGFWADLHEEYPIQIQPVPISGRV
jgi:hypothetical protein